MNREQVLTLSLMGAFQVGTMFHSLMPDFAELRESPVEEREADVRAAELAGGAVGMMLALGVAAATDSPWPIVAGLIATGSMIAVYEFALRTP